MPNVVDVAHRFRAAGQVPESENVHVPSTQSWPVEGSHLSPQPPQLSGSLATSLQPRHPPPPHALYFAAHAGAPPLQTSR